MSDIDDLKRALEQAKRMAPTPAVDSVQNHDGLAVFKRAGRVVGWMNWADFKAACEEMNKR